MLILVCYDVSTTDKAGQKRLRRVARACLDYGQRVQNSVFEVTADPAVWATLRGRLLDEYDAKQDSLRFYFLGSGDRKKVEHHGTKPTIDLAGPLIA